MPEFLFQQVERRKTLAFLLEDAFQVAYAQLH